jgi:O-antigen ligase
MIVHRTVSENAAADEARAKALTLLGALPVATPFLFPFAAGPSVSLLQLLASGACVAMLLLWAPPRWPGRLVLLWLAACVAAIALIPRGEHGGWLPACAGLGVIALAAGAGAGLSRPSTAARLTAVAYALLTAGLLSALLGLLQYYGLAAPWVPWTTAPDLGQAYGNLRQRNQFASLISMALIAVLWLHGNSGRNARRALILAAALLLVALAASTSRTGLLQLLMISGISSCLAWRERRPGQEDPASTRLPPPWTLLVLVPAYFFAAWLLPLLAGSGVDSMMDRLREGAPDAHSRLVLWANVLDLIGQHPWTGWGWGELSFAHYSTLYQGLRFTEILDNAHNLPLHLAVELGIPAALLICGGFGWLVMAARPWREADPARLMAWGLLGVIVLHSLLEYPLWYGPFQLVFGLCLGFLWPSPPSKAAPAPDGRTAVAASLVAALPLIAIVAYAAWDYTRISQLYLAREERLPAWRDDTLAKVQDSWLFANQVKFAELALTTVDRTNAAKVHALAQRLLHFSPEPCVIVKLIESATLLGRDEEAFEQAKRFRIAFPRDYANWLGHQPRDDPSE